MMGCHGTGHAFLRYNDMVVPDSQRLGVQGEGLEVALSFLDYSRVSLSNSMVGLAQRALDEATSFAKRRTTFGRPIADRQAMQAHIANMFADVNAGRQLVYRAAERFQRGDDFTTEAATAKLFCLNMIGRVTDLSLRVHGGYGYTTDAPDRADIPRRPQLLVRGGHPGDPTARGRAQRSRRIRRARPNRCARGQLGSGDRGHRDPLAVAEPVSAS